MLTVRNWTRRLPVSSRRPQSKAVKGGCTGLPSKMPPSSATSTGTELISTSFQSVAEHREQSAVCVSGEKYTYWKLRENKDGKKIFMSRNDEGKVEFVLNLEGIKYLNTPSYNLSEVAVGR